MRHIRLNCLALASMTNAKLDAAGLELTLNQQSDYHTDARSAFGGIQRQSMRDTSLLACNYSCLLCESCIEAANHPYRRPWICLCQPLGLCNFQTAWHNIDPNLWMWGKPWHHHNFGMITILWFKATNLAFVLLNLTVSMDHLGPNRYFRKTLKKSAASSNNTSSTIPMYLSSGHLNTGYCSAIILNALLDILYSKRVCRSFIDSAVFRYVATAPLANTHTISIYK